MAHLVSASLQRKEIRVLNIHHLLIKLTPEIIHGSRQCAAGTRPVENS